MSLRNINRSDPQLAELLAVLGPSSCPVIREMALPTYDARYVSLVATDDPGMHALALYITEGGSTRGAIAIAPDCPAVMAAELMDSAPGSIRLWLLPAPLVSCLAGSQWREIEQGQFIMCDQISEPTTEADLTICRAGAASAGMIEHLVPDDQVPVSAEHASLYREWLAAETFIVTANVASRPASIAAACLFHRPAVCLLYTLPECRGRGLSKFALSRLCAEIIAVHHQPVYAMTSHKNVNNYLRAGFRAHSEWRMLVR